MDELSEFPTIEFEPEAPGIRSAAVGIAAGNDSPPDSHERTSRKEETAFAARLPPPAKDRSFQPILTIFPRNGPLPAR